MIWEKDAMLPCFFFIDANKRKLSDDDVIKGLKK